MPVNKMIESEKLVPCEFIVGLYITNDRRKEENNNRTIASTCTEKFVPNTNFIGIMTEEEKKNYFESIKDILVKNGLRKVTDNVDKFDTINRLLGIPSYYQDELKKYQQNVGKHK